MAQNPTTIEFQQDLIHPRIALVWAKSRYEALLKNLGTEKATKVWQVFVPSHTNYLDIRPKLFEGKDEDTLDKEIMAFSKKRKREHEK